MEYYHASHLDTGIPMPPIVTQNLVNNPRHEIPTTPEAVVKSQGDKESGEFAATIASPSTPVRWIPTSSEARVIDGWFGVINQKAKGTAEVSNRMITARFVVNCGIHKDVLRRIWGIVFGNTVEEVSLDKFTVLIRVISVALKGYEPTMSNYYATSKNTSIPLPSFTKSP